MTEALSTLGVDITICMVFMLFTAGAGVGLSLLADFIFPAAKKY